MTTGIGTKVKRSATEMFIIKKLVKQEGFASLDRFQNGRIAKYLPDAIAKLQQEGILKVTGTRISPHYERGNMGYSATYYTVISTKAIVDLSLLQEIVKHNAV